MNKTKIFFLDAASLGPEGEVDITPILDLGDCVLYPRTAPDQVVKRSLDADVIITNKVVLSKEIISQLPKLKMIAVAATGYNVIDIESSKKRDIPVCNVSGYSTSSVAQMVFALLLNYLNKTEYYQRDVKDGGWSKQSDFSYWDHQIHELAGKTIGILGMGNIGTKVATIATAFDMKVVALERPSNIPLPNVSYISEQDFWTSSDIITLHAPLSDSTRHIINARTLTMMKPSTILVNTGRGDLIDEIALKEALEKGLLEAALLDVLSEEPPPHDHPLLKVTNCHIIPHQGWASLQSRQRLVNSIAENIKSFLDGNLINRVA